MVTLQADFPDIADDLLAIAGDDTALAEALDDYQEAYSRSHDKQLAPQHRADWTAVRTELVEEIRRLFALRRAGANV